MAIERTIGIGGDYADVSLAYQWLATLGNLVNDYIFYIITNNTISLNMGAIWPRLNGHTVTFSGITTPDITRGSHLNCVEVTAPGALSFHLNSNINTGNYIVENLYINGSASTAQTVLSIAGVGNNQDVIIRNCFIEGNRGWQRRAISTGFQYEMNAYLYNLKIWNSGGWAIGNNTGSGNPAIQGIKIIENCTCYNCGGLDDGVFRGNICLLNTSPWTLRNVVAVNGGWLDYYFGGMTSTLLNCASSDETASTAGDCTDCIDNIVPADEFESLSDIDDDFLELKDGTKTWV